MQSVGNINKTKNITIKRVTVPASLKPKGFTYSASADDFMSFISSQHPLINVWLIFSLVSIGILSVLLYII